MSKWQRLAETSRFPGRNLYNPRVFRVHATRDAHFKHSRAFMPNFDPYIILIIPTRRTEDAHLEHSRLFRDALLENSGRIWKRGWILLGSFRCWRAFQATRTISVFFGRIRARPNIKWIKFVYSNYMFSVFIEAALNGECEEVWIVLLLPSRFRK